jgi:hypothetical protein
VHQNCRLAEGKSEGLAARFSHTGEPGLARNGLNPLTWRTSATGTNSP